MEIICQLRAPVSLTPEETLFVTTTSTIALGTTQPPLHLIGE